MKNDTYELFKRIPKMTNNHIHLYALYPYDKLLTLIKKIDPELYNKIFIFNSKNDVITKYSLLILNEKVDGLPFNAQTTIQDWTHLKKIPKDDFVLKKNQKNPWITLELIQARVRIFLRHYKVYYYLIYASICKNVEHGVFYLNIKSKPGNVSKDTKFGTRFYLSKDTNNFDKFQEKMKGYIVGDKHVRESDIKYMYKIYGRVKYESDIIMSAVNSFNEGKREVFYKEGEIFDVEGLKFDRKKDNQVLVQYVMTFVRPAGVKDVTVEVIKSVKFNLYCAVFINYEYGFDFFNGYDFVGEENYSEESLFVVDLFREFEGFGKFGLELMPHFGETNRVVERVSDNQKYIVDNISRFGHGLVFLNSKVLLDYIRVNKRKLFLEVCPISNYLLGYFKVSDNPGKKFIYDDNVRISICSDDNGVFGYYTVTHDYVMIHKYWKLNMEDVKRLISNGMELIPDSFREYYVRIFNEKWKKYS